MEENKERNIVWKPQPRQLEFMRRPEPEALYGGAAGGGKSDALVIEALRHNNFCLQTTIYYSTTTLHIFLKQAIPYLIKFFIPSCFSFAT